MCEKFVKEDIKTFDIIRQELMRHLSENSNIKEISRRFGALNKNLDRVDFVLNLLEDVERKNYFYENRKCDKIAENLREEGNKRFKSKNIYEALELYTESICYAEKNTINLSLAYANRSAVLYEMNLKQLCLEDISRALNGQYPETLKPKLLRRQENAEKGNWKISEALYYYTQPAITTRNPRIQCASDNIEINESAAFGRYIVAARDVKCGEILAIEKPFAFILVNQVFTHCHECIELCYNLIPCESCVYALYCSSACRKKAYNAYHQYECCIMHSLKCLNFDKLKLLSLKIAMLTKNKYSEMDGIDSANLQNFYRSDRYNEIHNLITNSAKRSVSDMFTRATAAAFIFTLIKNNTNFFAQLTVLDERRFKELLLLHMQTGPSNFHEITELALRANMTYESQEIGSGSYAFLSLLNHSCSPNVVRFCHGSKIVLRAIKNISKGEQCFDNYGYHFAVMNKEKRQESLKNQYYFECFCKACNDNWNLYGNLPSTGEDPVSDNIVQKLAEGDIDVAKSNLPNLLDSVECLQKLEPSKNFCQLQETIKQCYALFGNKVY